jgi:hypothetical protein
MLTNVTTAVTILLLLRCRFIQETSAFQKYVAQPKGSKDVQLLQIALQEAFLTIDEALKKVCDSPIDR